MAQRWNLGRRAALGYGAALGVALALALSLALLGQPHAPLRPPLLVPLTFLALMGLGVAWWASLSRTLGGARPTPSRSPAPPADDERARWADRERTSHAELETALQALVRSDRRVDRLKDSDLFGVLFWDGSGRILEVNAAAKKLLGRSDSDLTRNGLTWPQLLEPGPAKVANRALEDLARAGHSRPFETDIHRPDGSKVPVLLGAVRLEGPELEGAAFLLDISERKRAEDALRFLVQASTLLSSSLDYPTTLARVARLVVSGLADWCVVELEDHERVLRRVAAAHTEASKDVLAQGLLGQYPLRQQGAAARPPVLGRTESEIVEDPRALMRELAASEADAAIVSALGCRSAMVVPLVARDRTLGALLLVSDREGRAYGPDDLKLAEDLARRCATAVDNARLYFEAQEAIRARDEFLSIASHELKTPLTSLHLQLQTIRRAARSSPEGVLDATALEPRLRTADAQVRRLARLIDDLLDISRIRLGRLELSVEEVDLSQVTRELVARFVEEGGREGASIVLDAPGPVVGSWDRPRLEQVVTNLFSNALKYGAGKPIEVKVERVDGKAQLTVRDHGIGIPLDQQVRIFERFERAVSARHFGGMGLGLYIVRQIVDAHGGSVRVQSRSGQGSTFTVVLPAQPALQEGLPQSAPA